MIANKKNECFEESKQENEIFFPLSLITIYSYDDDDYEDIECGFLRTKKAM